MEEVVVTGSRIKRTAHTQNQELITFTAQQMQLSGNISVADALRTSNLNTIGSFRQASGYSDQSDAVLDLRGMGASRTLVMINGRRVVGAPAEGGGGTVNLNIIPFAAISRVEVLPDGESAIYGSDAIAGVVNIILKKHYQGLHISARHGKRSDDPGTEDSLSLLTGASSDRASITMALEYDNTDPIFDSQRSYTKAKWGDYNGDGVITGYAETTGVSFYGYSLLNPNYNPAVPYSATDPSTWLVEPGANCKVGNGFTGPMAATEVFGPDSGFYCGYAYGLIEANVAGLKRINSWISSEYDISDKITAYTDIIMAHNRSWGRYAPAAAPGPTIPGDPRNNIGATYGYFRWTSLGDRDNVVNDHFTDINTGVKGDMGNGISWDVHYTFSNYQSTNIGNYYLSYGGLAYNIQYGITDPTQFVDNMKATTSVADLQRMQKITGGMQFNMFSLPGGEATGYVGAEFFKVHYEDLYDGQSAAGLVGGSAGNSATGDRDVRAVYGEAALPATSWLSFDVALRYDNYSDFGTAVSPRIGATMYIPGFQALKLTASWGKGFRAPDLSELYGATTFSAEAAVDKYGCLQSGISLANCPVRQFNTYIGSNQHLQAEKSNSWTLGAAYNFMGSWTATVDYFDLTLKNAIDYVSAQDQLDIDLATNGGNTNNVIRNNLGAVTTIYAGYANSGISYHRSAIDFGLKGSYDTSFGTFGLNFKSSHYMKYDSLISYASTATYNEAGTLGFPKWRSNVLVTWNMGNWFASWNDEYIGQSKARLSTERYPGWSQVNLSVGYSFKNYGKVTVGANNLMNRDPVLDQGQWDSAVQFLYPNTGRVVYLKYDVDL